MILSKFNHITLVSLKDPRYKITIDHITLLYNWNLSNAAVNQNRCTWSLFVSGLAVFKYGNRSKSTYTSIRVVEL
jgi:hypothetical protein